MAHIEDRWFYDDGTAKPRNGTGKRYRVRWVNADGAERSESFPDRQKGAAERFKIRVEADLLQGTYLDPDAGKISLRGYEAQWRKSRSWDASTRQTVEHRIDKHILPGLGDRRLDQLSRSPSIISGWLSGLPVGAVYSGQLLSILSSILGAAVDDGRITRNPCRTASVKARPVTRRKLVPWESAQVAAMRAAVPGRYRGIVDCGSGLGERQGEIFGQPANAINWLRRSVHVRVQIRVVGNRAVFAPPKGGREREIPLANSVSLALAAHMEAYPARAVTLPWLEPSGKPHTEELIFTTPQGRAISRTRFNDEVWRPARKAAGLANVRANGTHALRHYWASVLLAGGVDIEALSEYLGHHDPGFTLRYYGHLRPSAEGRAVRAIEAALDAEIAGAHGPLTAHGTGGEA